MQDDNKIPYFFLGLGVGVAIGVLFAPKSGEETRGLIRDKAGEGKNYIRRRGEDLRGSAEELIDRSKQALRTQKEQLAAAVDAGKQAYRETTAPTYNTPLGTDAANDGV